MTEREVFEAILLRWADGWEVLHPGVSSHPEYVPWTTENEEFAASSLGALGAWARISIQPSTSEQRTVGSAPYRKFERRGSIFVQLFAPIDQGMGLLADLDDDVREVLEGERLGDLLIYAGATQSVTEDGARAMRVVVLPYRYTSMR